MGVKLLTTTRQSKQPNGGKDPSTVDSRLIKFCRQPTTHGTAPLNPSGQAPPLPGTHKYYEPSQSQLVRSRPLNRRPDSINQRWTFSNSEPEIQPPPRSPPSYIPPLIIIIIIFFSPPILFPFPFVSPSSSPILTQFRGRGIQRMRGITYWLAEHPAIVGFRWSHAQSWGSTWSFLISAIALYVYLSLFLRLVLHVAGRRRPVPLGPLPALHSLAMALASAVIFAGILLSSLAEIRDTRWFWRRTKTTPFQWLFCFPLGTRPAGRVFFWSYAFYLSRFLHLLRTFFAILQRRPPALARLFSHSALVCMSFLWLEFSQSFQVVAILSATLAYVVVFGYRFWVGVGLPVAGAFPVVVACQVALLGCNLVCHLGVLLLHLSKGGCNGIGAWVFNSVLNAALLLLFVDFHVKRALRRRKGLALDDNCGSVRCHHTYNSTSYEAHKDQ